MAIYRNVYEFGKQNFFELPVVEEETLAIKTGVTYCGD